MKYGCLFCLVACCVLGVSGIGVARSYKIGPGDVLDIAVWKNPDLTRQVVVLPDGRIHFPLVGEFTAEGVSVPELREQMIKQIERYVPDPVLTISVNQVRSMTVYVVGKVNRPGSIEIHKDIDVLQALSVAGGLNAFAKEKEVRIFRKEADQTQIFFFNYKEVSKGEGLEQNILLKRGDVIVVR